MTMPASGLQPDPWAQQSVAEYTVHNGLSLSSDFPAQLRRKALGSSTLWTDAFQIWFLLGLKTHS